MSRATESGHNLFLKDESLGHKQPSSDQQSKSINRDKAELVRPTWNFLPEARLIKEFWSPCDIDALCPTTDGHMYAKLDNTIRLLNTKGEIQHKIKYNMDISDVRVSPTTQNFWTCSDSDFSVMECSLSDTPIFRFKTDEEPWCLCVTVDNSIIVGMSKQITKYTEGGKILLTTKPSLSEKSIVISPWRVSECWRTKNIAVADLDTTDNGGTGKPHVMVMDKNFQVLFRYKGVIPKIHQQRKIQTPHFPWDVRYDYEGNLIISDQYRGCLHLLNGRGDYVKLIHSDRNRLYSVGIDANNILWLCTGFEWSGKVKVKLLQYLGENI